MAADGSGAVPEREAANFFGNAETMAERLLATIDQYHAHVASHAG